MPNIGATELILLLLVILLLFGAKRIPDLARSLGRSIGEFKRAKTEGDKALMDESGDEAGKGQQPKDSKPA